MTENIRLEIVTPQKTVVGEDAKFVVAPGTLGEFGVYPGHTPFLTTLKIGTVKFQDAKGKERLIFVSGGFSEALPEKVTILAESAEEKSSIDVERARSAMERAQKRLASEERDIDFERARAALERALHRLKLIES